MRNANRNLKFMESVHLKSLFYFFKVFGMAPLNLNIQSINNAKLNRWIFTQSHFGIAYNILLLVCISIFSYLNMNDNYFQTSHWGFDGTIYAIVDIYAICITVFIIFVFSAKQNKLLVLFNKVNSVRETIKRESEFNCESDKLLCKKIVIVLCVSSVMWTFLFGSIMLYEYNLAKSFAVPLFSNFLRYVFTLQYCMNLQLVEDLFGTLNKQLRDLSKYFSLPTEITHVHALEINNKLSQIWEWYSQLSKLSRGISSFYSFPMLMNILCEFLTSIALMYYVSKPLIFGNSDLETIDYISSILFILMHVFTIVILTTSAASAVDKSERTIEMISDYLKESEVQIIKEKLLHFSIYLIHNNIEFTVFDLFSMDGSLLVSITGSVTTYLVILLQFQPPPSACCNSTAISTFSNSDVTL